MCSFEGCDRPGRPSGLCLAHLKQQSRGGELKPLRRREHGRKATSPICSFEGCGRKRHAYGLCKAHRYQQLRGVELFPIGDREHFKQQLRQHWASLSPEEKRRRTEHLSVPYERTPEWRQRMSEIKKALYAEQGGPTLIERPCLGCGTKYQPNAGGQKFCTRECARHHDLALSYGLTYEQLTELRRAGCCAICGSTGRLYVDHDHSSGKVRGMLCNPCNTGLGKFGDDPARLLTAIAYLERHGKTAVRLMDATA